MTALVKHAGGFPTFYCPEILNKTFWYFDNFGKVGDAMPSICGLADYLELSRQTLWRWASDEGKEEFCYILERMMTRQEKVLLNQGLMNKMNSNICKLALGKHGYHDRVENANYEIGKKADNEIQITFPTHAEVAIRNERAALDKEKEEFNRLRSSFNESKDNNEEVKDNDIDKPD